VLIAWPNFSPCFSAATDELKFDGDYGDRISFGGFSAVGGENLDWNLRKF